MRNHCDFCAVIHSGDAPFCTVFLSVPSDSLPPRCVGLLHNHSKESLLINARTVLGSSVLLTVLLAAGCHLTPLPATDGDGGADAAVTGSDGGDGGVDPACGMGEPNDTREQSTAIDLDKSYAGCVSATDGTDLLDFYELTAPMDAAGGYVEVTISGVGPQGLAELIVTSSADNDVLFDAYTTDNGGSVKGWLTVAPGAKYRVRVSRFAGAGTRFAYSLDTKYTKINDTFEPNNSKADAKPISLNMPIQASAAAVSANTALAGADAEDWFKVTLAAGNATVKLSNSPSDHLCDVELIDNSGQSVGENYTTSNGANCQIDATALTGGTYYVNAHTFAGVPLRAAANAAPPAQITAQYTLVVMQ